MKKLILAGVMGLVLTGCATTGKMATQQSAEANALRTYEEVVTLNNMNKGQIFEQSKIWIAKRFKSANNVIQYADGNTGTIVGKGNMKFPCVGYIECTAYANSNVNFTLTIDVKDGKAKLAFTDLGIYMPPSVTGGYAFAGGNNLPIWQEKHKPYVISELKDTILDYKQFVSTPAKDW